MTSEIPKCCRKERFCNLDIASLKYFDYFTRRARTERNIFKRAVVLLFKQNNSLDDGIIFRDGTSMITGLKNPCRLGL